MKLKHLFFIHFLFAMGVASAEEIVKNGDFTEGHQHWDGTGKVVLLRGNGESSTLGTNFKMCVFPPKEGVETAAQNGKPTMEIQLSDDHVTGIFQRFRLPPGIHGVLINYDIKSSPDAKFNRHPRVISGAMMRVMPAELLKKYLRPDEECTVGVFAFNGVGMQGGSGSSNALKPGERQTFRTGLWVEKSTSEWETFLALPPGTGTIWVASVVATPHNGTFGPSNGN